MKVRISFLLLALLFLLSACTGPSAATTAPGNTGNVSNTGLTAGNLDHVNLTVMGDSAPMPGFDAQNKYASFLPMSSFQEADGFYFGNVKGGNFLHYYDISTGISDYLCADPACLHNDETCGAYTRHGVSAFWYNGQRWWIAQKEENDKNYYLYRSDLSGLNQVIVKRIDLDIMHTYQPQQFAIHRGNLFLRGSVTLVEGTETTQRYTLLASPLDDTEEFAVLFDLHTPDGAYTVMRFAGTKVYYSVDANNSSTITSYDVATQACEVVFEENEMTVDLEEFWISEDGQIYMPGVDADGAYLWKVENGKLEKVWTLPAKDYVMIYLAENIMITISKESETYGIQAWDFDGQLLAEATPMFPQEIPGLEGNPNEYRRSFVGGDNKRVIMYLEDKGKKNQAMVMLDVQNNLKPTLLWSQQN